MKRIKQSGSGYIQFMNGTNKSTLGRPEMPHEYLVRFNLPNVMPIWTYYYPQKRIDIGTDQLLVVRKFLLNCLYHAVTVLEESNRC
jgi:hypothetical protein